MFNSKNITIAIALLVIIGLIIGINISKKNKSKNNIQNPANSSGDINIQEINKLITQNANYEAKITITPSSGQSYFGYTYISPSRSQTVYHAKNEKIFSAVNLQKNEIINYNPKIKKGVRIPTKPENKQNIFRELPENAKIISQSELVNNIDCFKVSIQKNDEAEILWISKKDGIIIKREINNSWGKNTFELTEIKNNTVTEEDLIIPEEIEIMDLTSEEFASFTQNNTNNASILISVPILPSISLEPIISPISSETATTTAIEENLPNSLPSGKEGIFEETNPYLPSEIFPVY